MYRVMYKDARQYVADRDGTFYYVRRVPHDVRQHYASSRISFSLRTKSHQSALRAAKSVTQRLEDYWLGLRLQQMDIPDIDRHEGIFLCFCGVWDHGRLMRTLPGDQPPIGSVCNLPKRTSGQHNEGLLNRVDTKTILAIQQPAIKADPHF